MSATQLTGGLLRPSTASAARTALAPSPLAHRHLSHVQPARNTRLVARAAAMTLEALPEAVRSESTPAPSYELAPDTKYAIIEVGGTQLIVEEGRWYTVNRLQAEPGNKIAFGRVLALKEDGHFNVGRPFLSDVRVEAEVLEDVKGPKLLVYKMKPKKHYRRTAGHRQPLTKFLVTKILHGAEA